MGLATRPDADLKRIRLSTAASDKGVRKTFIRLGAGMRSYVSLKRSKNPFAPKVCARKCRCSELQSYLAGLRIQGLDAMPSASQYPRPFRGGESGTAELLQLGRFVSGLQGFAPLTAETAGPLCA
jgi:hypothetical protein